MKLMDVLMETKTTQGKKGLSLEDIGNSVGNCVLALFFCYTLGSLAIELL